MLKRITVAVALAAAVAVIAPAGQSDAVTRGRTPCLMAGTCAPTYGGPTAPSSGRPHPAWHVANLGRHVGWDNAAHQRLAARVR